MTQTTADGGQVLLHGRYRCARLLKPGPGVATWVAEDLRAGGAPVVVKLVRVDQVPVAVRIRLEHEAAVLARLGGASFNPLLDFARDGEHLYLVQPLLPGRTLAARLAEGPLPVESTLVVAADVLRALQQAHDCGVLHRDVKPSNVMIRGDEPVEGATLIDFGLSRSEALAADLRDQGVGTARYLAPEQAGLVDVAVDERSDLYSLGVVLFECLAGRPPFEGSSVGEVLRQHLSLAPPPLRSDTVTVPRALEAVVLRLLGKDQRERYQSAAGALADVEEIAWALQRGVSEPRVVIGHRDRRSTLTEPAFVGRAAELAALAERLEDARGGHGGLVLMAAESGGGKTRLLDELAERARPGRAWVLRGQGVDQAAQRPYQLLGGVAEAVAGAAAAHPALRQRLRDELGDRAEAVATALPDLADALGPLEYCDLPEAHGETRSVQALPALVAALGSPDRPALVLLDDCQWADELTVRLLAAWQRHAESHATHVLVVAAFRSEEVGRDHPLRAVETAASMHLRPLTAEETRHLAESMAGPLPDDVVETLYQLAEGMPFMTAAVLRGLVECGALVESPAGWRVEPSALADVQTSRRAALFLVRRLELLSADALELLTVGAVLGKEFDLVLAMELTGQRPAQAAPALEEARRRRILWVDPATGRGQFLHDKLREALLGRLDDGQRRELHRSAAEHLEAFDPDRSFELAYHFDAAGEPARALPYALAAAEHARRQYTLDIAEAHYRMAQRAASDAEAPMQARIAEGLGEVLTLRGSYREAAAQLEAAAALCTDATARAAVQAKLGDVAFKCGEQRAARAWLEGALREMGGRVPRTGVGLVVALVKELVVQAAHTLAPSRFVGRRRSERLSDRERLALRIYSRLAYVYWFHSGKLRCAWAHLRELNLAERSPRTLELAQAYSEHAPVMTMVPWYRRGIAYAERSLDIRTELGDVWGQGQSLGFQAAALYSASRYREALEKAQQAARLLERTGDRWEANTAGWHAALALYRLGQLGAAADEARRVHQAAVEIGDRAAAGISVGVWARATGGDVPAELIAEQLRGDDDDAHTGAEVRVGEAVRLLAVGDADEAVAVLRDAQRLVRRAGLRHEYVAAVRPWLATALRRQVEAADPYARRRYRRLVRRAARAARRAARLARSYRNNRPHALRERGLVAALAGRPRTARRHLAASLAVARSQGARWEEAQTRRALATVGAALGWPGAADDLALAEALEARLRPVPPVVEVAEPTTLSLADRFTTLLDSGRDIAAAASPQAVYEAVRRAALDLLRGERCHVLEVDAAVPGELTTVSGDAVDHVSRTMVERALATGAPVVANHLDDLDPAESLVLSGVRSLLCAPIACDGRPRACFYVTHGLVGGLFGAEELQLASFVATLAGAALEHVAGTEARFRSLAQNSSDVVSIVGRTGAITYQSSSVQRLFGFPADGLVGTALEEWVHPEDRAAFARFVDDARSGTVPGGMLAARLRREDGTWVNTETTVTDLSHDPSVGGLVLNTRDVSERHALEQELRRRAWHDPLTDLPNRSLFTDRVEHALARGARVDDPLVVLYLDLDDFKEVNDTLGHKVGDALLREVADRLLGCVRPGDTVARLGGDEFALLLDGAPLSDAIVVAERIVGELDRPFDLPGGVRCIHASIGIAAGRPGLDRADELVANADTAMFAAKKNGKHGAQVFVPEMRRQAVQVSSLRSELDFALARDELVVHYQPIVSVASGRMIGAEALLRWRHPRLGLLTPADFIPLAEQSGAIVPIGSWVLRQACAQARAWQRTVPGADDLGVSVNLSARQLRDPGLCADVRAALAESGLAPRHLTLEITESSLVDDTEATARCLRELKALGLKLCIDDFGTGYSALSYLRRFEADVLKIDRTFLAAVDTDDQAAALVWGIAGLARALRLSVVAEGIERLRQLEVLTALGCDGAQGYNWSPPVPADEVERWLRVDREAGGGSPVRVLLVDDEEHMRGAVGVALATTDRYRVVAEAGDGRSAVQLAATHQPDLVLLDVRMPGMSGIAALPGIAGAAPGATVVLLTADDGPFTGLTPAPAAVIDKACDLDRLVGLLEPLVGVN